jgi:hypothetical protein
MRHHLISSALNQRLGEEWRGRGGSVNWPARSSDFSPPDFCLSGHPISSVYSVPISNIEVLQQRVENACQDIREKPGIWGRLRTSVWWEAEFFFNSRDLHRASAVEITQIWPLSQQALISGCIDLKGFWRWCMLYRAVGLVLDFIHRLVCGRQKIPQRSGDWRSSDWD